MIPREPDRSVWDAIIIGGGPAGLAAGMHLARAGYRCVLLEKGRLGGQAVRMDWIENYPGFPKGIRGRDLMKRWVSQARRWGLVMRQKEAAEVFRQNGFFRVRLSENRSLKSRTVMFCTGASFKSLGVPGERRFWGKGIEHEAFDRAFRFRGKIAAVVGGGETAVHQSLLLSRYARRVYLISRGSHLKVHRLLLKRLKQCSNLVWLKDSVIEEIEGSKRLERILWVDQKSGARKFLDADGLFVLIGQKRPVLPAVDCRRAPGFFVAGDASGEAFRQVAVAAGDGVRAAMKCIRYLEGWGQA
ncbi:MAG: FAD-dependent oxidoreductase [Elusimicrobia bacterium]|nr:FAD-dependent oxidoreductase [Elusimicrobiota bacterium]